MRSHVVGVRCRLVHAKHEARATRCANRRSCERVGVPNPLRGELVEMRRRDIGLTVATKIVREIFADDPENVGLLFC